ncbi:MAG TPA: ABC transporter permease [Gemmatimonadaceae bacterium]
MRMLSRVAALVRNLVRRDHVEQNLDDELRGYLDALIAEKMRAGLSRADAERNARLELGGIEIVKENVRDTRTGAALDVFIRDLRFAARGLRKTPAFTLAAVIALALGIGATTAILSVVDAVLLQPLPYANADQLVVALHDGRNPVAPANFVDWRAQTRSFTDMAAAEFWTPDLTGGDDPEAINALHISVEMLPMLGVRPMIGRTFNADEGVDGNDRVVVLSYGLWQRKFAGDHNVLGKTISLNAQPYTIVGVMPKTFQFAPFWATHAELWAPLALGEGAIGRGTQSLRIFARIKPGVTFEQARGDLASVTAHLESAYPGTNKNVQLVPLKEKVVGNIRTPVVVLLVAVAFVLLTACANVAHMLLARAASRHRELAVRMALGATRRRLLTQLLVESVLLAAIGGAVGLALAVWGVHGVVAASPAIIPRIANVTVDTTVLFSAIGITAVTAIVFGLLPAMRSVRVDLAETFRDGDRASTSGRGHGELRNALVASEFALALVLLAGAGLMIRSFVALQQIDAGFDPRNVVSMIVSTAGTPAADSMRHANFYIDVLSRVRALPNVASASFINHRPLDGDMWGFPFRVEGRPVPKPGDSPVGIYRVVFPGYFATMRIPILRGRDVAVTDRGGAPPVVVINAFMAKAYWPDEDAVGKRIALDDSTWVTVVGVVKNDVRSQLSAPAAEEMFFPFYQRNGYVKGLGASRTMTLVVRGQCNREACDAASLAAPVRSAIRTIERSAPISAVTTMTALVEDANAESRFYLVLLTAFAIIAMTLASVGIYGVMSYSVSRRTHEIGIRIALGADAGRVVRAVVRQGLRVTAIGASIGLVAAFALTRLMRGILYGVSPTDTVTFAGVTALLFAVAVLASLIPARRATRVDPLTALRAD